MYSQLGVEIRFGLDAVTSSFNKSLPGGSFNFNDISDTFLSLAAISPCLVPVLKYMELNTLVSRN